MNSPVHSRIRCLALVALFSADICCAQAQAAIAPLDLVAPGAPENVGWTRLDAPVPPVESRILLDASSRLLVAFPDRTDEVWTRSLDETARWQRIPVQPPYFGSTGGASIVYDATRGRFLLVRTFVEDQLWQVWALTLDDAPRWTRVSGLQLDPAITYRSHPAVIFDEAGDRLVLYGGYVAAPDESYPPAEAFRAELWDFRFDEGQAWRRLPLQAGAPEISPGSLSFHDGTRGRMLVLGVAGPTNYGYGARVWEIALDGSESVGLVASASCLGYSPKLFAASLDAAANRLVVDAGLDYGYTHGAVPLQGHSEIDLGGGGSCRSIEIPGHCPRFRYGHSAVFDPIGSRILLVGGRRSTAGKTPDREIEVLSLGPTPTWRRLGHLMGPPHARREEAVVVDPLRDRIVVTGGGHDYPQYCEYCRTYTYSDAWSFQLGDGGDWSEILSNGTNGDIHRPGASVNLDPVGDRLLRFGGSSQWPRPGLFPHDDFLALSLTGSPAWAHVPIEGSRPAPRIGHATVLDSRRQRILMLNGSVGWMSGVQPPAASEVWSYSLVGPREWSRLPILGEVGPSAGATATYDPLRDRVLAVAGSTDSATPARVWTLDLDQPLRWREHSFAGDPSPQCIGRAVQDPTRRRTLYFEAARFGNVVVPRAPARVWALEGDDALDWRLVAEPSADDVPGLGAHPVVYDGRRDRFLYAALAEDFTVRAWTLGEPRWTAHLRFASQGSERASERSRNGLARVILSSRSPWSSPIHPAPLDVHALDPGTIQLQGLTLADRDRRGMESADVDGDGHDDWILSVRPDASGATAGTMGLQVRTFDGAQVEARFDEAPSRIVAMPLATNIEGSDPADGVSVFTARALAGRGEDLGVEVSTSDESSLEAELFDIRGRRVASTVLVAAAVSPQRVRWAGTSGLAPGVYLARIRQGANALRLRVVRL